MKIRNKKEIIKSKDGGSKNKSFLRCTSRGQWCHISQREAQADRGNGVGCECIRPLPLSVLMLGKSHFLWNVEINVSRSSEVNSGQKRFHPFFHQNDCFVIDEIEDSKWIWFTEMFQPQREALTFSVKGPHFHFQQPLISHLTPATKMCFLSTGFQSDTIHLHPVTCVHIVIRSLCFTFSLTFS